MASTVIDVRVLRLAAIRMRYERTVTRLRSEALGVQGDTAGNNPGHLRRETEYPLHPDAVDGRLSFLLSVTDFVR